MSRTAQSTRKRSSAPNPRSADDARPERLQKVLAAAGLGSRRQCEQLIEEGRVEIDRQVADELGVRVDPEKQEIRVDGAPLKLPRRIYYAVNKPRGVVCTNRDPQGRTRVVDLAPDGQRLFPVGRLDRMSEGLILLTNDGALANRLTHPRYEVEKTYRVVVAGHPEPEELRALRDGVRLAEGVARVESVRIKQRRRQCTELEIVLKEGRNREIRRLLARTGHKVLQLVRIAVGSVRLADLPTGAYRRLSRDEVRQLAQGPPRRKKREPQDESAPQQQRDTRRSPQTAKAGKPAGKSRSAGGRKSTRAAQHSSSAKPRERGAAGRSQSKQRSGGAKPANRPAKGARGRRR